MLRAAWYMTTGFLASAAALACIRHAPEGWWLAGVPLFVVGVNLSRWAWESFPE